MSLGLPCYCRYNAENGGPALESLTNAIYEKTKTIKEYYISSEELKVDLTKLGTTQYLVQRKNSKKFAPFTVQVSCVEWATI